MLLELAQEQKMLQKVIRDYATEKILPEIDEYVQSSTFPTEMIKGLAEIGVMGIPYPEEYGGLGEGMVTFALALEEISRVDASVSAIVMANSSPATLINLFGNEDQKHRWLTPMITGQFIGAIGLTEASGGSDTAAIKTRAEKVDQGWVVNGSKLFITNSGNELNGVAVIAAQTGEKNGKKLTSSFIVPRHTEGYIVGPKIHTIGWQAADSRELTFEDVYLPDDCLLGEEGSGIRQLLTSISYGRISIAACALGVAQGAYEEALEYAKIRQAFGHQISKYQGVSFKLADMATQIDAARLMVQRAAKLADMKKDFRKEASMAKLFATEMAMNVVHQSIQIHGGIGLSKEHRISKMLGDAKLLEIVEGTSEIQRMYIARLLGC
ncbi:acyl-CoA dehydrogenase family protein [Fictibacillus sp. B-59209]|uniref:acyl-CoA dehydrogenase family protein n=1 Tax=Fictibacillus sp. B-59209 TaxID=3024873 RepID=UPI002E2003B3|nr:acyl-CoA dehydrogenase family protein [Fictibacillus sp. B-59209]